MDTAALVDVLTHRVRIGPVRNREIESVSAILDRITEAAIEEWYRLVLMDSVLMSVPAPMTCEDRCGHLPQLFDDPCGSSPLFHSNLQQRVAMCPRRSPRAGSTTIGLYRRNAGRGVAAAASLNIPYLAQQSGQY
jgi:hypothetical protein